jgi:hypothetical protein
VHEGVVGDEGSGALFRRGEDVWLQGEAGGGSSLRR